MRLKEAATAAAAAAWRSLSRNQPMVHGCGWLLKIQLCFLLANTYDLRRQQTMTLN